MDKKDKTRSTHYAILMNMLWSVLAVAINCLINFLLTPYVTNNIGVEAYGFVSLATTFTNYVDIISIGLNAFACRFISLAYCKGDLDRANTFFSSTLAADLILAWSILLLSSVGIFFLQEIIHIPAELEKDVKLLFLTALVKYLLTIVRTAYDTAAFIADRLDIAERKRSISYFIQAIVLLVLCTFLPAHVWYVGVAGILAALYLLLANVRIWGKFTPELKFNIGKCSGTAVKELISAGLWNSLNNLGNVLNSGLDLIITNLMFDAAILGEISIAKNLAAVCYTVVGNISGAFRPRQLALFSCRETEQMVGLYKTSMKTTGLFCNLIICVFFVCGRDFLGLWLPGQDIDFLFTASMIVLLSDIAIGVVNPLYYVFTLTKKLRFPCLVTIGLGTANVISMYFLIRYTSLGAYAVILTTLVLNCVHFIDTPLYAAHCLGVRPGTFYPVIFWHLLATAIGMATAVGLNAVFPAVNSWLGLVLKGAGSAFVLLPVLAAVMFRRRELKAIFQGLRH